MEDDPRSLPLGSVLAAIYRIERLLGAGSSGAVFAASVLPAGGTVALKVVSARSLAGTEGVERFHREAAIVRRLSHPSSIRIFDAGSDPRGFYFIAFELLDGVSLEEAIATRGAFPVGRALTIMSDILAALSEAHSIGFVHRDVKPANIFLAQSPDGKERVKVLDFGLAKSTRAGTRQGLTVAGSVVGTPLYMAPEQLSGDPVDARTDVFACGMVLGEMVYGRSLYDAETDVMRLMVDRISGAPVPIPAPLPAEIASVVRTATALDPNARYQSAQAMQVTIGQLAQLRADRAERGWLAVSPTDSGSQAQPVIPRMKSSPLLTATVTDGAVPLPRPVPAKTLAPPNPRGRARTGLVVIIAVLVLGVGGGGTAWWLVSQRRTAPAPRKQPLAEEKSAPPLASSAPPPSAPPKPSAEEKRVDYFGRDAASIASHLEKDLSAGRAYYIVIYEDKVRCEAEDASSHGRFDHYEMRGGVFEKKDVVVTPPTNPPLDANAIPFAKIPNLVAETPAPRVRRAVGGGVARCRLRRKRRVPS